MAKFKHANVVVFTYVKWTIAALCALVVYLALYFEINITLGIPSPTTNVIPAFLAGLDS